MKEFDKLPRIYVHDALTKGNIIPLTAAQAHYFKNVLRRQENDTIRIFNGHDGEWSATLSDLKKKSGTAICSQKIKDQPNTTNRTHLFFAPIKKSRMDILIEKSVELGVTDLHPIITERTQYPKINANRITAQIIEAAEQCERMDIPTLHNACKLHDIKYNEEIFAALERGNHPFLSEPDLPQNPAFLIGPVGGFTDEEAKFFTTHKSITPISLGTRIYRAETAAILCLSHATLK